MALIFVPALGSYFGRPGNANPRAVARQVAAETGDLSSVDGFMGAYIRLLTFLVRRPLAVVFAAVLILAGVWGYYLFAGNGVTFFADVDPDMRLSRQEVFGPAVGLTRFDDIDTAIAMANDSIYGLSAGIFTQNIDWALKFARQVHTGNVHVNWGTQWRADIMPYGGVKDSGMGKEGPKYAVEEMTELKLVVFH